MFGIVAPYVWMVVAGSAVLADATPATTQPQPRTAAPLLLLNSREPDLPTKDADGGLLIREIIRQAVLIAGRDGFGLATRDMTLREPFPAADKRTRPLLNIKTAALPRQCIRVAITFNVAGGAPVTWKKESPLAGEVDYHRLVELCEVWSRTEFVDVLKQAGFDGSPNRVVPDAAVPDRTDVRLGHMSFFEQFAALRDAHRAIRESGESQARLGILVRGYATLGELTAYHWNAAHKALKARALLYAQRMVVRDPKSPSALWHRAYARAMAGFHGAALEDLEAARKLAGSPPTGATAASSEEPAWGKAIDAYCRYDIRRLQDDADARRFQLAMFLAVLALEHSDTYNYTVLRGGLALDQIPECYRVHDILCARGGVGLLHQVTELAPTTLTETLPKRLTEMSDLPAGVKSLMKAGRSAGLLERLIGADDTPGIPRAKLVRTLLAASDESGDLAEPSWAVLGRMIEETTFVQVFRRVHFMRHTWSVPIDDYLRESLPLIADHPYKAVIENHGPDSHVQSEELKTAVKDLHLVDVGFIMQPAIQATWGSKTPDRIQGNNAWALAFRHTDVTAWDLYNAYWYANRQERSSYAHRLLRVSPYSPQARAGLIHWDWGFAEPRAAEWEGQNAEYPTLHAALGQKYSNLKRYGDAERCLKKYIALSPDQWAYVQLADNYWNQDKKPEWCEILDGFLKTPDYGLEHAQVQVKLARYYMSEKQWAKAAPYAEAAARTWAGWAMVCASECYEGMEEWEKSEAWIYRNSERYDSAKSDWFLWCKRTGHGDVESARKLAQPFYDAYTEKRAPDDLDTAGNFYILAGQPKKAVTMLRASLAKKSDPGIGLHLVILGEELGDTAARDEALKIVLEKGATYQFENNGPRTQLIALAAMFQQCIAAGRDGRLNLAAVDGLIASANAGEATNMQYFVGRFLQQHGEPAKGREYLQRCAVSEITMKRTRTIARDMLRLEGKLVETRPTTSRAAKGE